jgi:transcriptional antiterminator NusG
MSYQIEKQWYVVNTYSSRENKVKENLEKRVETQNLQDVIFRVLVAEQEVPVNDFFQSVKRLYETFDITDIDMYGPLSYITEQAYGIEKVLPYEDDYDI